MASILRNKAIANINKGNTSAYYSYVEEKNGTNPVLQQLEKELNDYMGFVKKKRDGYLKLGEHAPCKVSDALFDIWNKFESRVTKRYYYNKLMQIGEFLVQNMEYSTAAWQCYDRFLNEFISDINFSMIQTVQDLKDKVFPQGVENDENSDVKFRALMGHCICLYHFTITNDSKLQNANSVQQLVEVLRIIRLIMQLQLEIDHYCWLVYNGTIYTYTICRYMMQYGLSKQVLEYLLWCCLSMESSIPLLGIKYLTWRATLYVATCQCYYDCKFSEEGEMFARRALAKINELHELELASVNGEKGARAPQFRDATIKVGAMLFKRMVFESKRKNKSILRPKVRAVYKDLHLQAWPRTSTEKLLCEMFDCTSSQFLAIEEALSDSNRRIAMPAPAAGDNDVEILDITLELFFAAEFLANGGGGKAKSTSDKFSEFKSVVGSEKSLIQMAINGEDTIPLKNLLKVIQLAFSYEVWDIFRRLSNKVLSFFQSSNELATQYNSEIQILNLLQTIDKYLTYLRKLRQIKENTIKQNLANKVKTENVQKDEESRDAETERLKSVLETQTEVSDEEKGGAKSGKSKKSRSQTRTRSKNLAEITEDEDGDDVTGESSSVKSAVDQVKEEDLLANIAHKLIHVVNLNSKSERMDLDIMIDTTLLLWKKCKEVFQKYQTGSQDNYRWVTKLENLSKWLYILNVVHDSMCYFNISSIDPAVFAHCSLRLALLYESLANIGSRKSAKDIHLADEDRATTVRILDSKSTADAFESFGEKLMTSDVRGNLMKAKRILKKALHSISSARASISKSDKSCLCNKNYNEANVDDNEGLTKLEQLRTLKESIFLYRKNAQGESVWNMIGDLHVELIFLYNKISVRLLEYGDLSGASYDINVNFEKNFESLLKDCKKNKISQSLLYLAKALYLASSPTIFSKNNAHQKELIEKAYNCLLKAQEEDKRLFNKHVVVDASVPSTSKVPLAPVVYLTTHNKIVLRPRNFQPANGETVSWYRVFASQVTGPNSKARISDYNFPGSGDQIPSNNSEPVSIHGLVPDEKYIFAVAAYNQHGKLIGDSIGESTDPILASSTLSTLMNWAYLCQISYQINSYNVAKTAFEVLWNHFMYTPIEQERETCFIQNEVDYKFAFHQLNFNVVRKTSPVLLRKFLECIFISVEIKVKENQIYCDLLFDGKLQYNKQIERLKECEKLLVVIELAGWLNDAQIILQAVVQCYGLLAPLLYYSVPYEPVVQVLTHCLFVLEELPITIFQNKVNNVFESLQHMIACTTYYLTEILKKRNVRTLANVIHLIGKKLVSIEESGTLEEDENEFITSDKPTQKTPQKPTTSMANVPNPPQQNTQQKKDNKNRKTINQSQLEEKPATTKNSELRALELYISKTTKPSIFYNVLNGNEETTYLYAFIALSPTKYIYKELSKFRRRTSYLELVAMLLQKALTEELTAEILEWCAETQDYLQKRNINIMGNKTIVTKKVGGVITVADNPQASLVDFGEEAEKKAKQSLTNFTTFKRRKIKKYKLLIPLQLEVSEKVKLEEKQKAAIDKIYDIFPDMHDRWVRRRRLRRLLHEEGAYKAQMYNIWALGQFGTLINKIQQTTPQNEMMQAAKLFNNEYLNPQQFLFEINNGLIVTEEEKRNPFLKTNSVTDEHELNEKVKPLPIPPKKPNPNTASTKISVAKLRSKEGTSKSPPKSQSVRDKKKGGKNTSSTLLKDRLIDVKDTCDLVADVLNGLENEDEDAKSTITGAKSVSRITPSASSVFLKFSDVVESMQKIFMRFERATIIAYREKEWTLLQNICKTMWNCMNTLLTMLPAALPENSQIKMTDFWIILCPCIYTAADNLLDMLFYTTPIEKGGFKESSRRVNKWFDSLNVGKGGAGLGFDAPLDDITSIDLRFVKQFVYRAVQCLYVNEKWEKLASVIFKYNALTSYNFAEQLSPILIYAQHQLRRRVTATSKDLISSINDKQNIGSLSSSFATIKQPHFDRLRAELGRQPKAEDLFFIQFKIQIDPSTVKPINLGVKIDPRVHDIYNNGERAKQLVSIPLDIKQSLQNLNDALQDTLYTSRALMHTRRLLSIFLLSKSSQLDVFGMLSQERKDINHDPLRTSNVHVGFDKDVLDKDSKTNDNTLFSPNPADLTTKRFDKEADVTIKHVHVDLKTVIESYTKCIDLLLSHKEQDLAVQAMHELGNLFYYSRDLKMAYRWWNESLDTLTSSKDCLIKWRKEFQFNSKNQKIDYLNVVTKFGIWGCVQGGLLASKIAQYLLAHDIEMRTEACLLSATFYKSIYQASVPHSKHDIDYAKEDSENISTEFLIPGLNINSEIYRFDIRNVIASLNYVCLELINAKHYMNIMPVVNLYEYFSRNVSRDMTHTVLSRLIKAEALIYLNRFDETIMILQKVHRGEKLPHFIDEKIKPIASHKYNKVNWNSSKPIFDVENLKCLEIILSMKLPMNIIKLYGPQLICKFYLTQTKLFVQIASSLTCLPNLHEYNLSTLCSYHISYTAKIDRSLASKISQYNNQFLTQKKAADEDPDAIKVFTKNNNLTLEFIKGCLLGTSKTLISKCLQLFYQDFPNVEKYSVSYNWQREYKYELNILLANIADQCQLDYMALQYITEAMDELNAKQSETENEFNDVSLDSFKHSSIYLQRNLEGKQSRFPKKGMYELFDIISKSHLNSRLWMNARRLFTQYMFNQMSDLGKAKGVDPNIVKDFADLKYYCEKGNEEASLFQDSEARAHFEFIIVALELMQTNNIDVCLTKLNASLDRLRNSTQLSYEAQKLYLKVKLLEIDLKYSSNIIESNNPTVTNTLNGVINELFDLQEFIFDKFIKYDGEIIEVFTNREFFYFDFLSPDIKNLYSPFLYYFLHVKLRLGSCLMIHAAQNFMNDNTYIWNNALKTFYYALELNKIVTERSVSLELELRYRYARCLRELSNKKQINIKEVIEAYLDTINLCYNSTHDLNLIKNCYLEMALTFMNIFTSPSAATTPTGLLSATPDTASSSSRLKKTATSTPVAKAMVGALVCLTYALKVTQSIREKMLLPGHASLKLMDSVETKNCPIFVANDLLAYYALAERKRVYRDKIEEEVLTLAPEFSPKPENPTYDQKVNKLIVESNKSITWTHLLNYQSKLQRICSMRNLNQFNTGKNRHKFSEYYTLAFTPIFNNSNQNSARLFELNKYLSNNLEIYRTECTAAYPLTESLRACSRKAGSQSTFFIKDLKNYLINVRTYEGNRGLLELTLSDKIATVQDQDNQQTQQQQQSFSEETSQSQNISKSSMSVTKFPNLTNLESWPANYDYNVNDMLGRKLKGDLSEALEYLITLNWYKDVNEFRIDTPGVSIHNTTSKDYISAILGVRDPTGASNQIKIRSLSTEKVHNVHNKLAPLAAIADTALESSGNSDIRREFINSLKSSLQSIGDLFNKKLDISGESNSFDFFELKSSNVIALERIFNPNFGGQSNDESLKMFLLSLF